MPAKNDAGKTSIDAAGWAVVDGTGKLMIWTVTPERMETIKCRVRQIGGVIRGPVPDAEVEKFWIDHKDDAEDVTRVLVRALLN
jgi:hypothetical protein